MLWNQQHYPVMLIFTTIYQQARPRTSPQRSPEIQRPITMSCCIQHFPIHSHPGGPPQSRVPRRTNARSLTPTPARIPRPCPARLSWWRCFERRGERPLRALSQQRQTPAEPQDWWMRGCLKSICTPRLMPLATTRGLRSDHNKLFDFISFFCVNSIYNNNNMR